MAVISCENSNHPSSDYIKFNAHFGLIEKRVDISKQGAPNNAGEISEMLKSIPGITTGDASRIMQIQELLYNHGNHTGAIQLTNDEVYMLNNFRAAILKPYPDGERLFINNPIPDVSE